MSSKCGLETDVDVMLRNKERKSLFCRINFVMVLNKISFLLLSFILITTTLSLAQESGKRISPLAMTSAKYKDSYIKVVYGQPAKKDRQVFGTLVPFEQVWRTGANEATEITTTRDIIISTMPIAAGTYSLFTIPNQTTWTIILNKEVGLWGAYNYNPKFDVARWEVPVKKLQEKSMEWFTIQLDLKNNTADLNLCWDDICVTLPIQFNEPKQ
jgi:Protein of unknown function (DUF2911)